MPLQHGVRLQPDRVQVALRFEKHVQLWDGERRITTKVLRDGRVAVTSKHRLQYQAPVVGTGHVPIPQQRPLQIAQVVEAEDGMIAGAFEMAVVRRTFLPSVGLAHRTVEVENQLVEGTTFVNAINPHARQIHQCLQVLLGRQNLRLEAAHLTGGCGLSFLGPTAHHLTHRRVNRQPFRVVRVLVTRQATVHRLSQHAHQLMLCVLAAPRITEQVIRHSRHAQRFIQFAIRDQSRVRGNGCAVEFQLDPAVEIDPQRLLACFTHHNLQISAA